MSRKKRAAKQRRQQQNQQRRQRVAVKSSSSGAAALSVKGLTNLGNTCYFNAAMQVLMNAPLFGELMTESKCASNVQNDEPILTCLVKLYQDYASPISHLSTITPSSLIGMVRQKTGRFPRNQQADSHELLRFLLDCCKHQVIDMLFGGYFLASVVCRSCKSVSQHFEPFRDISLALSSSSSKSSSSSCSESVSFSFMGSYKKNLRRLGSLNPSQLPANTVQEALARFTANELLDEANKIHCEKCDPSITTDNNNGNNKSSNNEKQASNSKIRNYQIGIKSTLIAIPPPILTIHLKRFRCDGNGQLSKISNDVNFEDILDISSYTSEIYKDIGHRTNNQVEVPILYSLFGIVCHTGSLRGGHYTAMVKARNHERAKQLLKFVKLKPRVCQPTLEWVYKDNGDTSIDEPSTGDNNREHLEEKVNEVNNCQDSKENQQLEKDDESTSKLDRGTTDSGSDADDEATKADSVASEDTESLSCAGDLKNDVPDNPKDHQDMWYHISDSSVSRSNLTSVLRSQAYMLFYERISGDHIKVP